MTGGIDLINFLKFGGVAFRRRCAIPRMFSLIPRFFEARGKKVLWHFDKPESGYRGLGEDLPWDEGLMVLVRCCHERRGNHCSWEESSVER